MQQFKVFRKILRNLLEKYDNQKSVIKQQFSNFSGDIWKCAAFQTFMDLTHLWTQATSRFFDVFILSFPVLLSSTRVFLIQFVWLGKTRSQRLVRLARELVESHAQGMGGVHNFQFEFHFLLCCNILYLLTHFFPKCPFLSIRFQRFSFKQIRQKNFCKNIFHYS